YGWLLSRPEEIQYYKDLMNRVNSDPRLRFKVIFDPHGDDVPQWLSMVGYILSPSENESFHMAVGESLATGTMPVIWDWEGAEDIWGSCHIVNGSTQAKEIIAESGKDFQSQCVELPSEYSLLRVCERWSEILHQGQ